MKHTPTRRSFAAGPGAACVLGAGCATTEATPTSGFLGDYQGFAVDPADQSLLWWERDGFDWSSYQGVILEPVSFYYHAEAADREIRPDELKRLADAFRDAVVAELGGRYRVTQQPAADVLRVAVRSPA